MRLTVIGCSGSYPGPDSPASCYLLEADHDGRTWRVLVDLGSGALGALHQYVDPLAIDAVFLSHLHADHCLDLCGYYVLRKYHPDGHQPRIPVCGPVDTADRMARAYDLADDPGMNEEFDFREYDGVESSSGRSGSSRSRSSTRCRRTRLRIEADGATVGYSGDTGPCAGLDAVATEVRPAARRGVVRVARREPDRSCTSPARSAARPPPTAGSKRLVLTHVPPWHDPQEALVEARTTYAGELELAHAGAVYDL